MSHDRRVGAGCTVWLTGVSGAGKSTVARALEKRLRTEGASAEVLDGDLIREHLCKDLGFTKEDRDENVRRVGFVCELLSRNGVMAIAALISPYRALRDDVRRRVTTFIEVHMTCPLDVLVARDPKGLYKKALAGELPRFTGVSDPYEPPLNAEVTIDSSKETLEGAVNKIWAALVEIGAVRA